MDMLFDKKNNGPDTAALREYLPANRTDTVLCLDTVDSTNNKLKELARAGAPDGQVVIADGQTCGRGRSGRSFLSPKGKGIYMSVLYRLACPPSDAVTVTAWTAVAVCGALKSVCGVEPKIKWVNDVVLNGKKLCGILTEMLVLPGSRTADVIIGVGVNTGETDFPEELRDKATSAAMETEKSFTRARLAAELINALDKMRGGWPDEGESYLKQYTKLCMTVGRRIAVVNGSEPRAGIAVRVNADFSLRVAFDGGEERDISSGEVSVRGLYGYV